MEHFLSLDSYILYFLSEALNIHKDKLFTLWACEFRE